MLDFLKNLFGGAPAIDYPALMGQGAQIIDVRTPGEYAAGHIKGAINIPLNELPMNWNKIKKNKPVITCCASGMRSASAKNILSAKGFDNVHNGGGWLSLQKRLQ